jgi:integrase
MGYILEDGELLRPLSNIEYDEFKMIVSGKLLVRERLMVQIAVASGARKQSILTIRLKNLSAFEKSKKLRDGTFLLLAGPGTGIDTKNGTRQKLYIPSQLAEEILVYAGSPEAKRRRSKFRHKYAKEFPDLREMPEEDFYLFLSDQGGEFYMGKDDPRYPRKKSRPIGQVTNGLQKKIFSMGSELIPLDFTFHWLRATFAFHLYQRLMPLIESGHLNLGEEISLIQKRMHHMRRETTENYLKLFNMRFERLEAQEKYEDYLFGSHGVDLRK